ncbi:MAG: esterase/lipase family protein [Caldimonas sp.]|uniref:esterase/lipase family protein n=1 Tax=Caldimonas sp. TaxID=2838790 RepID=UPI00391B4042
MNNELDMSKARVIEPEFDHRGTPIWKSVLSPPDDTFALVYVIPTRIIPVIFVPGVMGSNLKPREEGERWRMDSKLTASPWIWADAKERKKSLRPEAMVVDDDGKVPTDMKLPAEELKRRGWGEIAAMSYGPALRWLEEHLNDFGSYQNGLRAQLRREALGAQVGEQLLSEDEVRLSYRYRFPVHAFGYNWLDDNAQSAQALGRRIDEIIERYNHREMSHGCPLARCEKVILVTHSMGGLVARHCSEVLGYRDKIYGIVHGVMPATGAAAVYRRMKAGTEGSWGVAQVLGADAAEVTAVLSSAPGPLQLLPSPEYGNGWLRIRAGAQEQALPQQGDPYGEIYTVRGAWWGLCDEELINPLNEEKDPRKRRQQVEADWGRFLEHIEDAKKFHIAIRRRYHPHTHAFCGASPEHKAYGTVSWARPTAEGVSAEQWMQARLARRLGLREFSKTEDTRTVLHPRNRIPAAFGISQPDEAGDGTVPARSGLAPKPHCQSFLRVPVEHEPAYNPEAGPASLQALRFTLRAIVRIAQRVRESKRMMYEDF